MKREIKFRGKKIDTQQWVYGGFHLHEKVQLCGLSLTKEDAEKNKVHLIVSDKMADWNMPKDIEAHTIIPDTIGQFTGVVDKNGKEIYEDDILTQGEKNYMVSFRNGGFWIINHYGTAAYQLCKGEIDEFEFEVIGNIHDNPDLING